MLVRQPYLCEVPVAHSILSSKLSQFCDNCFRTTELRTCTSCGRMRYCNRKCQLAMWRLHKTECQSYRRIQLLPMAQIRLLIRLLIAAVNRVLYNAILQKQSQTHVLDSLMSRKFPFTDFHRIILDTVEFKNDMKFMSTFMTVLTTLSHFLNNELPASEEEIFTMYCALQINSFMITDSSGADLAPAIYPNAARLDHSCIPDLEYVFNRKQITVFPVCDLSTKEQPRINYVDPLGTTAQRRTELRTRYFFECDCPLCLDEARESEITALFCCGSRLPEETYPYSLVAQQSQTQMARSDLPPAQSALVRRCLLCNTCYDIRLIDGVIHKLADFRDAPPIVENVQEALTAYHRMVGIDGTMVASTDSSRTVPNDSYTYYRLFGQQNNVYLAQVCRMATSALTEEDVRELDRRRKSDTVPDTHCSTTVDTLIACGVDLFNWYSTFLPWPAFVSGLHASAMVGFLLRSVSDDDMVSETRMARISALSASHMSEANLLQLLFRLASTAETILTPLAPYNPQIAAMLESLRPMT